MKYLNTRGIILRIRSGKGADKIVTLLTPDRGKVTAVSRSSRDPHKKHVGIMNEFHCIGVQLYLGKGLPVITHASLLDSFRREADITTLALLSAIAETAEKLTEEEHYIHGIYETVHDAMQAMNAENYRALLPLVTLKLLTQMGYVQDVSRCANCHAAFADQRKIFLDSHAKAVCQPCHSPDDQPLDPNIVKVITFTQKHGIRALQQLEIPSQLNAPLEHIASMLFGAITHTERKSLAFLQKLNTL